MPESSNNESANAAVDEPKAPSRMSLRRRVAQGIVEPDSKLERPVTVPIFQASPTSVATVLAKQGAPLETTLAWGGGQGLGTLPATGSPAFLVGAGRELLADLLADSPDVQVGSHGTLLALNAEAVKREWSTLAREGLPEQYWYKKAGDEFAAARAIEAGGRRSVELIDAKVLSLETLDRMFPRSLVVNVVPRWMQGLRPNRWSTTLPAARYLEICIADVKANPELVTRQVLEFLAG